jgi:hypothetical protein
VLLNGWEAACFDVRQDIVVDTALQAATAGCELLVLDDGWYGKRDDTRSGLGDRPTSADKLPHGLDGVAKDISARAQVWDLGRAGGGPYGQQPVPSAPRLVLARPVACSNDRSEPAGPRPFAPVRP